MPNILHLISPSMHLNVQPLSNFNEFWLVDFSHGHIQSLNFRLKNFPDSNIWFEFSKGLLLNLHLTQIQVLSETYSRKFSFWFSLGLVKYFFLKGVKPFWSIASCDSSLSILIYYFLIYCRKNISENSVS